MLSGPSSASHLLVRVPVRGVHPMRLLIVADLHYSLPQFDWLVEHAADYDAVIIAGDLLDIASVVDPGTQIIVVLKYLAKLRMKTRILVCSGNHDLDGTGPGGEKQALWMSSVKRLIIPADGDTLMLDDMMVTICAWWDGPATQKAIAADLEAAAVDRRGPWIWIYHAPPEGASTCWDGHRFIGDEFLRKWIERFQPDMVLSGHIHKSVTANYRNTTLICGSCWQGKTIFQEKVGHNPGPSRVPIVNLQTRDVKILKFGQ